MLSDLPFLQVPKHFSPTQEKVPCVTFLHQIAFGWPCMTPMKTQITASTANQTVKP